MSDNFFFQVHVGMCVCMLLDRGVPAIVCSPGVYMCVCMLLDGGASISSRAICV